MLTRREAVRCLKKDLYVVAVFIMLAILIVSLALLFTNSSPHVKHHYGEGDDSSNNGSDSRYYIANETFEEMKNTSRNVVETELQSKIRVGRLFKKIRQVYFSEGGKKTGFHGIEKRKSIHD